MKSSTARRTIAIYVRENLQHKVLFFSTIGTWTSGLLIQKLLLPLVIARAFDRIVAVQNPSDLKWSMFTNDLIIFVAAILISQLLIDLGLVLLSRLETRIIPRLHQRVYDFLMNQSLSFHANTFTGSLVNQTNRFVTGYVAITDNFVINIMQLLIFVGLSSAVLFFYSPMIAGTIIVWSLIFIAINVILTVRRIPLSKERAAADSKLTGYLADSVTNVQAVKTFAREDFELKAYGNLAKIRAHKGYVYWMRSVRNDAVFGLMMGVLQIMVLVVSIMAVQQSAITIGTLLLAQVYITQIIAYLWGLSNITKNIEQNLSDAAEMTELLEHDIAVKDQVKPLRARFNRGAITLTDVSFGHERGQEMLFTKLNLKIKPGEKVGLVGHSGGGKSTLASLLLRFKDIQDGSIQIDNQDIREVSQRDLRSAITYVPQEPILFHRSLRENIAYGKPSASKKEIIAVAKMAHAHDFIHKLPNGYETLVGERGIKLSGGQRQRVAIARAMLKNAPILVLDEATSALDSESEVLIQDALWKLMKGKTAIVVAHRLSTIQKMDRILVLENGQIIEQGSHKELLLHKGTYAKLWSHQSGGFLED